MGNPLRRGMYRDRLHKTLYIAVAGEIFFFIFEKNGRNRRNGVTNGLGTTNQGAFGGYAEVTRLCFSNKTSLISIFRLCVLKSFFIFFIFAGYSYIGIF